MMKKLFLFLGLTAAAWGKIEFSPAPLEDRYQQAAFVCIGTVLSVSQPNPWPLDSRGKLVIAETSAQVIVRSIYRGKNEPNHFVLVFAATDPMSGMPVLVGDTLLFFLQPSKNNRFVPLDTSGSIVSAPPIQNANGAFQSQSFEQLETETAKGLTSSDPQTRFADLEFLAEFRELNQESLLAVESSRFTDPQARLTRLAILSKFRPADYLPELLSSLETLRPESTFLLDDIAALIEAKTNTQDLPELERLATAAAFPYYRRCAMLAIRRFKSPETVSFLIKQLDSPNLDASYLAVISLAEITGQNGDFAPGLGLFDKQPRKYIDLWKQWWATQK